MINLLMIGRLSLGLNGHRSPETVGHWSPMQRDCIMSQNDKSAWVSGDLLAVSKFSPIVDFMFLLWSVLFVVSQWRMKE